MSELESPKLKIAGNLQFSKATTGLITVVVKDKSTQMQQREVASLVVLGDSMEREGEREREGGGGGGGRRLLDYVMKKFKVFNGQTI